jgi:hypothetical protein
MPTSAIPSRNPVALPERQRRSSPATRVGSKMPTSSSARASSRSSTQPGAWSPKNGATAGAR